ncbi:hypothetical protein T10_5994 [Trichinella papuae]|uniref:Uncharacterized protein n=1 Tax=Trichinella papuae TaxID=268474 RepID=A0A0V1MWS1_9BILA|nr:hypothetical protein T10_5994 [Trichinella papuae]
MFSSPKDEQLVLTLCSILYKAAKRLLPCRLLQKAQSVVRNGHVGKQKKKTDEQADPCLLALAHKPHTKRYTNTQFCKQIV